MKPLSRRCITPSELHYSPLKPSLSAHNSRAQGWGREFTAWLQINYPDVFVPAFECAKGSRQDIVLNGSVPIFVNRKIILEFLKSLEATGDNRLAPSSSPRR